MFSLTAFILMALYIENQLSYDRFNTKADNIYRVVDDKQTNALMQHTAGSAAPVGPALLADFSQVREAVRIIGTEALVKYNDKLFEERNIYFSDASIFKVFDFSLIKGDSANALTAPGSVVLTENTATKYFGKDNAVGKSIILDGQQMMVTGVIKNVPATSHLSFDFLVSMSTAEQKNSGYAWMFTNWYSNNFYTYILLQNAYDPAKLASQFEAFANRHSANTTETKHNYKLEKLTSIYLASDRENQAGKTGSLNNLYIFSAVALFILILACINFINLSTARATDRAKEIAIKKVNGVSRFQLILQFFIESFLTTGIALLLAVITAYLLLPWFNNLAGTQIIFSIWRPLHIAMLATIWVITACLSGAYPAVMLSGFKPVSALKGVIHSPASSAIFRKGLVVFQFAVSIILIIGSIVVYAQLQFMQTRNLGFRMSQTMVINFEGDQAVKEQYQRIKSELLNVKGVTGVTASSKVPGNVRDGSGWSMDVAKKTGDTVHAEMPIFLTDFDFMKQYGITMVAGRELSPLFAADTTESMLINETALQKLGFNNAGEAIGVKVGMYPSDAKIVGVFKDFHFQSLQKPVTPMAMRVLPGNFRLFSVEINTNNVRGTVDGIESKWKKLVPQRPLEYTFLKESFNQQYEGEIKFGQLFSVFTLLAIIIACFGLFGLALFSVKQRTKEIGVRKVLGASVAQITVLLSKDFIILVIAAFIIASPVALLIMNKWVQGFAYHITISVWIFLSGGAVAAATAIATISLQSVKAALTDPVKSLKNE